MQFFVTFPEFSDLRILTVNSRDNKENRKRFAVSKIQYKEAV